MKNILIITTLITMVITLTNCGGGGSSSGIALDFNKKDIAAYDLKAYLFDLQERDINITEVTYTNINGEKVYDNLPSSQIKRESHTDSTKIDNNIIKEYKDNKLESTSTIYDNKIDQIAEDLNTTVVRYVDIGDYFTKWSKTQKEYGGTTKGDFICKIDSHQDSMIVNEEEFNDILKVNCHLSITSDGKTKDNKPFNLNSDSDYIVYVAKGIGEIKSIDNGCEIVKVNGEIEKNECEKTVEERESFNP